MSGAGVTASGTFTTGPTADPPGFYQITGIAGTADGGAITALQPTGTAIPGNTGYPVDNLVSASGPQLTSHGFGFSVSTGVYHNPFNLNGYRDYISIPPYKDGAGKEPAVTFRAEIVPEPHAAIPLMIGLTGLLGVSAITRRSRPGPDRVSVRLPPGQ